MESDREQADLPAEQPPPRQDARLPVAYAHPRRPRDPRGPSSQGPQRAVGLSGSPAAVNRRAAARATGCGARATSRSVVRDGRARPARAVVVHQRTGLTATARRSSGSSSARRSAAAWCGIGSAGGCAPSWRPAGRCCRAGSGTVVRALPESPGATSAELGADLDAALRAPAPAAMKPRAEPLAARRCLATGLIRCWQVFDQLVACRRPAGSPRRAARTPPRRSSGSGWPRRVARAAPAAALPPVPPRRARPGSTARCRIGRSARSAATESAPRDRPPRR